MDLTDAEKAAILAGISKIPGVYDPSDYIDAVVGAIDINEISQGILATISGPVAGEVLESTKLLADRQARQIAGNLARAELVKIGEKVRDNLAAGNNPRALIGALTEIKGLDAQRAGTLEKYKQNLIAQGIEGEELQRKLDRMREKLLRDRRETIARTEQRLATEQGMLDRAQNSGKKYKHAISAQDERVSDICEENQAAGWIPIDEAFPSGDMAPTFHPNCRCTLAYKESEPDAIDNELTDTLVGNTSEAKEP